MAMLYTPADVRVGPLQAIRATIRQEINGEYTCRVTLPHGQVEPGSIVELADANGTRQKFRVGKPHETMERVQLDGEHITYDLHEDMILDRGWVDRAGSYVWPQLLEAGIGERRFSGVSQIATTSSVKLVRVSVMDAIKGRENSYLSRWGGELEIDNYQINVRQRLGADRGYRVQYRVNLTGLDVVEDQTQIVNRIIPTCLNAVNGVVSLPEGYIDSDRIAQTPIPHVRHVHYSDIRVGVEEDGVIAYPTLESAYTEMRARVQALYDGGADMPTVSAEVDFIDLAKTQEYRDYIELLDLELGDTVRADYDGRTVVQRMIAYEWDALRGEYLTITLGHVRPSLDSQLARIAQTVSAEVRGDVQSTMYTPLIERINELNEATVNAAGMYVTREVYADGSERVYYHDQPAREDSQIIEYYPEPGTRVWTDQGWQGGSPVWQYGYSSRGMLVMRLIATEGLEAEWIRVSETEDLATHLSAEGLRITSVTNRVTTAEGDILDTNERIDDLDASKDGRNLLLGSDVPKSATGNLMGYYTMSEDMEITKYTLTIKGQLGEGRTTFIAYLNGYAAHGGAVLVNPIPPVGDTGLYRATFTGRVNSSVEPNRIMLLHYPYGLTSETTVEWVKLEHGETGTAYSLAPEDLAGLPARVTTAETNINTVDGRVTTTNNNLATTNTNLSSAVSRINTAEGSISGLTNRVTDAEADIATVDGRVTTTNTNLATTNSNLSSVTNRVTAAEGNISTTQSNLATTNSNLSSVTNRVTDAEADIGAAQQDIVELTTVHEASMELIGEALVTKVEQHTYAADKAALEDSINGRPDLATYQQLQTQQLQTQQTVDQWAAVLTQVQEQQVEDGEQMQLVTSYMAFDSNGLTLGKSDSVQRLQLTNERINMIANQEVVSYWEGQVFYAPDLVARDRAQLGNHIFERTADGRTVIRYAGD